MSGSQDNLKEGLSCEHRLGFLNKNRNEEAANGVTYGGVGILWCESGCALKEISMNNPSNWEVLVAAGGLKGHTRKLAVLACYLPPGYSVREADSALEYITNAITMLKQKYTDPYIVVAGDYNQWDTSGALLDFPDLREVDVVNTRGNRSIDRIFTNVSRSVNSAGTLEPLETDDGSRHSDHRVAYCRAELARLRTFVWQTYSYRHFNEESVKKFKEWVVFHEWKSVHEAEGSNAKTKAYQDTICWALETFFPLKTTRRKSTDLPWMNKRVRKLIRDRKRLFWEEGGKRTDAWKAEMKRIETIIQERKKGFMMVQKDHLLAKDANRNFFKHVKNFSKFERPEQFDVRQMPQVEGKSEEETAELLADFFNKVSREFDPLQPADIPCSKPLGGRTLAKHEVAARWKKMRKPKSMVPGDIYPQLVTTFSDFFAIPLTNIYNEILRSYVWPTSWKKEFVTVIPKKTSPQDLGDLRNISCTLLASNVFESLVLDDLKLEVKLRRNQYGGVRGLGTDSLLVQLWQEVLQNLEDYRAGTIITSIDYAKAFNRMSFQHCLAALHKKDASPATVHLISTFLTNRTMTVKVGGTQSTPREVWGGCPQGSILGVFLFNATIDDLEEGCQDVTDLSLIHI